MVDKIISKIIVFFVLNPPLMLIIFIIVLSVAIRLLINEIKRIKRILKDE